MITETIGISPAWVRVKLIHDHCLFKAKDRPTDLLEVRGSNYFFTFHRGRLADCQKEIEALLRVHHNGCRWTASRLLIAHLLDLGVALSEHLRLP